MALSVGATLLALSAIFAFMRGVPWPTHAELVALREQVADQEQRIRVLERRQGRVMERLKLYQGEGPP